MGQVSRPMLVALLVGTVAFLGIFLVALKPSPSSKGGSSGGVGPYQSAIDKAKQAVATSSTASQAQAGTATTTPSAAAPTSSTTAARPTTPATSTTASPSSAASSAPGAAAQRLSSVEHALAQHKVVAILVYNPAASDDQAVMQELASVPTFGGSVVKLTIPVSELANYSVITNQLQVNSSPTLVIINRSAQATQIAGFADRFEIAQRVNDALASP